MKYRKDSNTKKLIIVESPGKIKKIQGFLGNDYKVMASFGHVRDLPEKDFGVAPPNFVAAYQPTEKGKKVLADLRKAIQNADEIYLATDPDREGEAIAWHLLDALHLKTPKRIAFSEITEAAVKEALNNTRIVDMDLVRAQEGRRCLDRLVGWLVSPALSNYTGSKLSAGRVQTPALKLVVEREKAISDFRMTTHYGVELTFGSLEHVTSGWKAHWQPKIGDWLEKGQEYLLDKELAERIAKISTLKIADYTEKESKQAPPASFTTSTLQQAASMALKFSPKQTMDIAQRLYENGHITYMRTDSPNLSMEAIETIRDMAANNDWPVPAQPRTWQSKAGAQEAHEAVRPTHFEVETAGGNADEHALYALIRMRAIACQLEVAVYAITSAKLEAELDGRTVQFEARGRKMLSSGWRILFPNGDQTDTEENEPENPIPKLEKDCQATALGSAVLQKKTKPPARYTEASLIKDLESRGIGRPSTYAAIMETIKNRKYIEIENRQLKATTLGETIIKALDKRFGFMDYAFTKNLEMQLDDIAQAKVGYFDVISEFYIRLLEEIKNFTAATGQTCEDCGCTLAFYKTYDKWWCKDGCKASFRNVGGKPGARIAKPKTETTEYECQKCGGTLTRQTGISQKSGKPYEKYTCQSNDCAAWYWGKDGKPEFKAI